MPPWGQVFNVDFAGTHPQTTARGFHFLLQKEQTVNALHLWFKREIPCRLTDLNRVPLLRELFEGVEALGGTAWLEESLSVGKGFQSLQPYLTSSSLLCFLWQLKYYLSASCPCYHVCPTIMDFQPSEIKAKKKKNLQAAFGDSILS